MGNNELFWEKEFMKENNPPTNAMSNIDTPAKFVEF